MDIFSHALLPYLLGRSFKRNKEEVTAFVLGGIAPDFDIFLMLINAVYPTFFLLTHRGITHSMFFGFITGTAVLYLASRARVRASVRKFIDFEPVFKMRTVLFASGGVALHLFLDYVTTLGIPLLYPLSATRFSAELFFYTDLFLTILSLIIILVLYSYKNPEQVNASVKFLMPFWTFLKPAVDFVNTSTKFLLIFCVIFALLGGLRIVEKDRTMAFIQGNNASVYPTSNPFDWYVLENGNDSIKIFEYNGSDGTPVYSNTVRKFNIISNSSPDEAIAVAEKLPQVKMFEWRAYAVAINATHNGNEWSLEYDDPLARAQTRDAPGIFKGLVKGFGSLNVTVNGSTAVVT
ncbi:LexA-binding, inner membrane-associated putative hydrolase [uncultured archaeon]|nr:LexA-binding, inner membrane-associated putative hydrolase [uncultured archaeon]